MRLGHRSPGEMNIKKKLTSSMGKPLLTFTSPGSHAGLTTFLFTNIYFWQTTHTKTRKPNGSLPSPRLSETFLGHTGVKFSMLHRALWSVLSTSTEKL